MCAVALVAHHGAAQETLTCEVARPMDTQRLLRRLSLDLRGTLPSHDDQVEHRGRSDVGASVIDRYLASPGFVDVMRRYHANLLWPNLDGTDIVSNFFTLNAQQLAPGMDIYWSPVRSLFSRTITKVFVPCRPVPATFDANGPVTQPLIENGQQVAVQEGYVEVEPYWAPGTRVKVCAFDALEATSAPMCTPAAVAARPYLAQFCQQFGQFGTAVGLSLTNLPTGCDQAQALLAPGCGCGSNLRSCGTPQTITTVRSSMLEQQLRVIDRVVREDRPYSEVLTAKDIEVNGPLAHYLRHQSRTDFDVFGEQDATAPIPPQMTYASDWTELPRSGRHAGVLTTAGFLLKFQSNRARAHRFTNAFECGVYLPSGTLPSPSEPCSKREDLTQRCGCSSCHVALEPAAAHWGRFAEYGHTPLDDLRFPKRFENVCTRITSFDQLLRCFRFYQLEAVGDEVPFRGLLKPYVFRPPTELENVEQGPTRLAGESVRSGRFSRCTVRRLWTHFMHRPPTAEEEQSVLPGLIKSFDDDDHRLRGLVKAIVTQPAYRRMP
jgi:hypothetical protein